MKGGPSYFFEAEPGKILTHKAPSTRALRTRAPAASTADFWQHGRYIAATVKRSYDAAWRAMPTARQ